MIIKYDTFDSSLLLLIMLQPLRLWFEPDNKIMIQTIPESSYRLITRFHHSSYCNKLL